MSAAPSKYFLDTNTLIDLATNEREFHKEAVDMVLLGAKRGVIPTYVVNTLHF